MFEQATKEKLRFNNIGGSLSVEDLWDLPLKSVSGKSLNGLAIALYRKIQENGDMSFVDETSPTNSLIKTKLDIVKRVIEVKKEDNKKSLDRNNNKVLRQKLLSIKSQRDDAGLLEMSDKRLQKMLDQLDE